MRGLWFAVTLLLFGLFTTQINAQDNKSINDLQKLIKKAKKKKDKAKEAELHFRIAKIHYQNRDYTPSIKEANKSKSLFSKLQGKELPLLKTHILLSKGHEASKQYDKAINHLIKAKDLAIALNRNDDLIYCYQHLAQNYKKVNDDVHYQEYINLIKAFDKEDLSDDLQVELIGLQKDLEQTEEALLQRSFELDITIDSLKEYEAIAAIQSLQLKIYDKENRIAEAELEAQNAVLKEQEANLKVERLIRTLLIGGLCVLILLGGVVFYGYRQKKKDNEIISVQKERITDSINYAKTIQDAMLPMESTISQYVKDNFTLYMPKDIVSGDYYWFHHDPKDANCFYISAVDCTGHGVPGAFMSMIGINQLNEIIGKGISEVNEILDELDRNIKSSLNKEGASGQHGMDMALCKVDKTKMTIEFAGARNPLVKVDKGEIEVLVADKKSIGQSFQRRKKVVEEKKFTKRSTTYTETSNFYMFSDGYADQLGGENNEKFMTYNFYELLKEIAVESLPRQKEILEQKHLEWKGSEPQLDDILVVGFKLS